jgi:hypothetical protein
MTDGSVGSLSREQLDRLVSYFDEEVLSAQEYKIPWVKVLRLATG